MKSVRVRVCVGGGTLSFSQAAVEYWICVSGKEEGNVIFYICIL